MATILCGSRPYVVTEADKLWLLRAVAAEGPVQEQVAQVLINCFALLNSRSEKPSLTWLVRSYAQPVNPNWYPDGALHLKWLAKGQDTELAARRRRDVHSTKTTFDPKTMAAVTRALTLGPVDIPPSATDYAAARIDASHKYRPLTPAERGKNRLWTRAPEWRGYTVQP